MLRAKIDLLAAEGHTNQHIAAAPTYFFRHAHGGTGRGSGHAILKNKWVAEPVTDFRYNAGRNVPLNPSEEEGIWQPVSVD